MPTKIKICGITCLEDAVCAIDTGADALGFVFSPHSPRYISTTRAKAIIQKLPPFVSIFGLCVNADSGSVKQVIKTGVSILQFHGDEPLHFCRQFDFPFIKAVRVTSKEDIEKAALDYPSARAILLDSFDPGIYGGSGKRFDWSLIPRVLAKKVIIAGGLTPDSVDSLLSQVRPLAVDVSSGVEAEKGVKSQQKMQAFCKAVRRFDRQNEVD